MKLKKILTSAAAAALLGAQAVCMTASIPAYAEEVDPDEYSVCDGALEEYYGSYTETLTVPAEIDGEKIIGVTQYAYPQTVTNRNTREIEKITNVRNIVISDGIIILEQCAFDFPSFDQPVTVTIPASVTLIGRDFLGMSAAMTTQKAAIAAIEEYRFQMETAIRMNREHPEYFPLSAEMTEKIAAYSSIDWERYSMGVSLTASEPVLFDKDGKEITLKDLGIDVTASRQYQEVNTIRGYEGTAAETYANRYGFRFESLGKSSAAMTGTALSSGMIAMITGVALILGILLGVLFARFAGKKPADTPAES